VQVTRVAGIDVSTERQPPVVDEVVAAAFHVTVPVDAVILCRVQAPQVLTELLQFPVGAANVNRAHNAKTGVRVFDEGIVIRPGAFRGMGCVSDRAQAGEVRVGGLDFVAQLDQ